MKNKIYALLSAPGVVAHEFGHLIFCVLAGVKVYKVKLFGFRNPPGFVEHEEPQKFIPSLLISFGPLSFNSVISLILFSQIIPPWFSLKNFSFLYLGTIVALHSIPSRGDAQTLLVITKRKIRKNPLLIIGYPFVGLIYLLNFLKKFHLQFIYTALLFWLGNIYLK